MSANRAYRTAFVGLFLLPVVLVGMHVYSLHLLRSVRYRDLERSTQRKYRVALSIDLAVVGLAAYLLQRMFLR